LRAIAVLLVVLQHLEFRHFGGGYVGVDVFFVISGYLIGSSMLTEFRAGTFSLVAFYERRVRRIFPALFVMLTITSVFAYRYLMATAFVSYAQSLFAAVFSFSNFFFWTQEGYFVRSATKPLLHTWSLGVEEQFYVFFPLLLYGVFRWWQQRVRAVLWALIAVSFLATCWVMRSNTTTAFYWSPLRAWELLAGVMVSQYGLTGMRLRWLRELASLIGLALVLYAGLFYTSQTVFPGWTATLPCLGAVLIIAAGQVGTSAVGRLLALPPMRFVGLISYSLYLWHWPVAVFQNTAMILGSQPLHIRNTKLMALAVIFPVATLSWWLVETPFRKGRLKPARRPLFMITGAAAAMITVFSLWVMHGHGMSSRFPPELVRLDTYGTHAPPSTWRDGVCFLQPENSFQDFKPAVCLGREAGHKTYLLYGDSVAAQLYQGLVETFPEVHFQQATAAACQPYGVVDDFGSIFRANCDALYKYLRSTYLEEQLPDAVIMASNWNDPNLRQLGLEIAMFQRRGVPVILVGPTLVFDTPLPQLLVTEMLRHRSPAVGGAELTQRRIALYESLDSQMAELARDRWKVRYISHYKELCRPQVVYPWQTDDGCPLLLDGDQPLILDTHHFTPAGSILFARRLREDRLLP
jgi:peptidoglycan/LPS O-acetylase OafA/YrhL